MLGLVTPALQANDLRVRPETLRLGESLEITLTLEGEMARADEVPIPIENLRIYDGPHVAREYQWINGRFSRRRIIRYSARAERVGAASVGPVRIVSDQGTSIVLPRVTVEVVGAAATAPPSSTEPSLGEVAFDRQPAVLLVEAEPREAVVGQQILVTWFLYSETASGFRILDTPQLDGFWAEELSTSEHPERVLIDGRVLRKVPVRRVALYPLRAGSLTIGSLVTSVQVLEPIRDAFGGWSLFERQLREVRRSSPVVTVVARPLPVEAPVVGSFRMRCTAPVVPAQGPVNFEVTVEGEGNLRSAPAPRFAADFEAAFEVEDLGVTLRQQPRVVMERTWRILIFPQQEGLLKIPELRMSVFDPLKGAADELRCASSALTIQPALPPALPPGPVGSTPQADPVEPESRSIVLLSLVGIGALIASAAVFLLMQRKRHRPDRERLLRHAGDPVGMRQALLELLAERGLTRTVLLAEQTERGEALRALHSMIDLMEKEPWEIEGLQRELRARVDELLRRI